MSQAMTKRFTNPGNMIGVMSYDYD